MRQSISVLPVSLASRSEKAAVIGNLVWPEFRHIRCHLDGDLAFRNHCRFEQLGV